jgi:hypothetical protein
MKYAVHYYRSFRYFNQVDEVVFDYKGTEYLTEFIPKFLKPEQRAVINVSQLDIEEIFEYLLVLKQLHENFVIQLKAEEEQIAWIPALEEMQIKYMFINFATTFEQVYAFSQYNVTDIYICEDLGFRLDELQNLRGKGIALRIFPDVAQSSNFKIPDLCKFFVRPEGLDVYEDYIDTIELWHCNRQLSVVYEIYKQRQWSGYLEDLILDFSNDFSLNNATVVPLFDTIRVKCGRNCLVNNNCHYCFRNLELSPLLEENDLFIVRKKDPILTQENEEKLNEYIKELKEKSNEYESSIKDDMLFEN